MAVAVFDSSKALPQKGIDYILDEAKVECSAALNLVPGMDYAEQMMATQRLFGKGEEYDERKYWHLKFSFPPMDKRENGGKLTPERALQFGTDVMEKFFPNHEVVMAVQNHGKDKTPEEACRHIHVIINAVDPVSGKKIHMTHEQRREIKDYVQELSQQYGLHVLDWREAEKKAREARKVREKRSTRGEKLTYAEETIREKNGRPIAPEKLVEPVDWKEHTKEILQFAKEQSCNFEEFERCLKEFGLSVRRTANTISYRYPGHKNGVRGDRLGEEFTPAALQKHFDQQMEKLAEVRKLRTIIEQRKPLPAPEKLSPEQIKEDEIGYLKTVIRFAKSQSRSMEEFEKHLGEYGVTLSRNTEKTISYHLEATGNTVRGDRLGTEFEAVAVRETLSGRPVEPEEPMPQAPKKLAEGEAPADVRAYIKGIVDYAKETAKSMDEFEATLNDYRISLPRNTEKTISFSFDGQKAIRGSSLGEAYSAEKIRAAIEANAEKDTNNTGDGGDDSGPAAGLGVDDGSVELPSVSDAELQRQLFIIQQDLMRVSAPAPAKSPTGWKDQIRAIVSYAKSTCKTNEEFLDTLKEYGVTCPIYGTNVVVYHHPGVGKDVRGDTLGRDYTAEEIQMALGANYTKPNQSKPPKPLEPELKAAFRELGRLAGIEADVIDRTIADADSRVLTKEEVTRLWDDYKQTTSQFWEKRKEVSEELSRDIGSAYASIRRLRESLDTDKEFWENYRAQKAQISSELTAAYNELRANRAASWALDPRNRKASMFAMFQAIVYKCRHDGDGLIQHRIRNLKFQQDQLYRSIEKHKQMQEKIRAEIDLRYRAIEELKARQGDLKAGTADFKAMSDEVYAYLRGRKTTDNLERYDRALRDLQERIERMRDLERGRNLNDLVASAEARSGAQIQQKQEAEKHLTPEERVARAEAARKAKQKEQKNKFTIG